MLSKQYSVYSVDTEYFYNRKERNLHRKRCILSVEKDKVSEIIKKEESKSASERNSQAIAFYKAIKKDKIKKIANTKNKMIQSFQERLQKTSQPRNLRIRGLDSEVISIFDSNVTRLLGMSPDIVNQELIIVRTYFFDVLQDIILHGFIFQGVKYRFFTASAGQIRTKKAVFIREDKWRQYETTLMCGLTIDKINEIGGMNINKFLAYLALNNSATDEWTDFDIDKTIVVPDYETPVMGMVDYIDYQTFQISRREMEVPITHTDGAGMILPSLSKKNFMVRLPWVKGLLCVFDFKKFIQTYNGSPFIKDIYGVEHNIITEDIQIIFTESQFKAHKYYKNWNEYKNLFKQNHCKAGICNVETDIIPKASMNYQMLQTLTDISTLELNWLASKSNNKLLKLTSTIETMKQVFGVDDSHKHKTYLQRALEIYPELLQDSFCKETLKAIKKAMVKRYRSGKLDIDGRYTFIIPDWFAVCENWFLGIDMPQGLLTDNQVSCRLYRTKNTLDCLRSPHLYREHAIRENVINDSTNEWYVTDGLYISTFDLISKLLQLDVDGDKSLVVAEKTLIKIAKRNMNNIVPLYYEMKKANAEIINSRNICHGLILAYTGGSIGAFSNAITKIWNNEVWYNGTDIEKQNALNTIKYLCMINNFSIDYAKTLFKPTVPNNVKELIHLYTKCKTPYFFKYAKDKDSTQVEPINNSAVNQLEKIILNRKLYFSPKQFQPLDYRKMMSNPNIDIDPEVIRMYLNLNKLYRFQLRVESDFDNTTNIAYLSNRIINDLTMNTYTPMEVSDMIIKYLYTTKDSPYKEMLWFCFGKYIVANLDNHLLHSLNVCKKCGKRFEPRFYNQKYCDSCGHTYVKVKKVRKCVQCGKDFMVQSQNTRTLICPACRSH